MKLAILAGLALGLAACGQSGVAIDDAIYRPPLGSTDVGVAYFTIRSPQTDRIVGVSSPAASAVEIHTTVTEGGRSSMRRLESVDLPAGETVHFEPGGMHLMVFSPNENAESDGLPIIFELESGTRAEGAFRPARQRPDPRG